MEHPGHTAEHPRQTAAVLLGTQYAAISRRCAPSLPHTVDHIEFTTDTDNADWLVLSEPNRETFQTAVPRGRRMLIVGEPSPLCHWPVDYVNQFGLLLSPYPISGFRGKWIDSHPALPWFVGWNRETDTVLPLAELEALPVPEKLDAVSVVVSRKVVHTGHRERLQFLDRLKSRLGERLQIFGRGIREVDDKLDAILPYKYHLALENTQEPNYWSEKLSDAFLGHALPIYAGCPNIDRWFGDESLVRIDLRDHGHATEQIEQLLQSDGYASYIGGIAAARRKVIQEESLFKVVARVLKKQMEHAIASPEYPSNHGVSAPGTKLDLVAPISKPKLSRRFKREAQRIFRQATTPIPRVA